MTCLQTNHRNLVDAKEEMAIKKGTIDVDLRAPNSGFDCSNADIARIGAIPAEIFARFLVPMSQDLYQPEAKFPSYIVTVGAVSRDRLRKAFAEVITKTIAILQRDLSSWR